MSILQSSLVEPLLSRQQTAVVRNIACATQLNEALKSLMLMKDQMIGNGSVDPIPKQLEHIELYLKAEITRVLMQIKTPAKPVDNSKEATIVPGIKPGTNTP